MEVSKLEAVKRQLNIAIYLYFNDMDLVSCHTLVGAARNILFDFFKIKNINFKPVSIISKLKKKHYENWLRGAQNFFKHASAEDQIKKFDLKEEMTENLLYDAISRYQKLEVPSAHMQIFISYFLLKNRDDISENSYLLQIQDILSAFQNKTPRKQEFYDTLK